MRARIETAVGACIDRRPENVQLRARFQPHRPIDATKRPVVAAALGMIDALVSRLLRDGHLDFVAARLYQPRDVVAEAIEPTLMSGARGLSVDLDGGVRHRGLEHEMDLAVRE